MLTMNPRCRQSVHGSHVIVLAHDEENHVISITDSGVNATYVYDGDGKRVKATVGGATTVYIGNYYERDNGTTVRKYYYAGAVRVAMRTGGNTFYLLNDHPSTMLRACPEHGRRDKPDLDRHHHQQQWCAPDGVALVRSLP